MEKRASLVALLSLPGATALECYVNIDLDNFWNNLTWEERVHPHFDPAVVNCFCKCTALA